MSVHWTCPSVRSQDPVAKANGEKPGPCPGHTGPCSVMHTPRPRTHRKPTMTDYITNPELDDDLDQ